MSQIVSARPTANTFLSLALVAAAITAPTAAHAGRTVIPATACQRAVSSSAPSSAMEVSLTGAIYNGSSTQRLTIVCPIPRSNTSTHPNWFRV